MNVFTIHFSTLSWQEDLKCYGNSISDGVLLKAFKTETAAEEFGKEVLDLRVAKFKGAVANGQHSYLFEEDGIKKMYCYEVCLHELVNK